MVTCDKFKLDDERLNTGASLLLLIVRRIEWVQAIFSFLKEDEEFLNPYQMVEKLNEMNDGIICLKPELDDSRNNEGYILKNSKVDENYFIVFEKKGRRPIIFYASDIVDDGYVSMDKIREGYYD